jgi:predicted ATPase
MNKNIILITLFFLSGEIQAHWHVAVTGGPKMGVTSVVNELVKLGYQKSSKDADRSNITFYDYNAVDAHFRNIYLGYKSIPELENAITRMACDLVFVLDPLPEEFFKETQTLTWAMSVKFQNYLIEQYKKTGYKTIINVPFDTPANRAKFIERVITERFMLGNIIDCFAGHNNKYQIKEFMSPVRLIEFEHKGKTLRFFGVHVDKQKEVNFPALKAKLMEIMGITNKKLVQVVGDSGVRVFSKQGSDYARTLLEDRFGNCGIIEYGYTGYQNPDEYDVNALVNEYIDQHPDQADRVLANIVGHIHIALNKWGCYASPLVQNFVVVYNDDGMVRYPTYDDKGNKIGGFTVFSEDVIMSDYMLQAEDGDITMSLEGGTQCWKQIINMLSRSIKSELIYNIRVPHKQHHFSVARFLKAIENNKPTTPEQVREVRKCYEEALEHLWDTTRQDNSDMNYGETKKKLLNECMEELINKNLYQRVSKLCTFFDAQN